MTNNQLAALIAKLTTTVNDQHNLVMSKIKDIKLKLDKHKAILLSILLFLHAIIWNKKELDLNITWNALIFKRYELSL